MIPAGAAALTAVVLWFTAAVCAATASVRRGDDYVRAAAWVLLGLGSAAMIAAVWLAAFRIEVTP